MRHEVWVAMQDTFFQHLLPLFMASLAVAALFIPAAEYISWDNYLGLGFSVLIVYFVIKQVFLPTLTTIVTNTLTKLSLIMAVAIVAVIFFTTDHPRGILERQNVIEIFPKEFGFSIHCLVGEHNGKPIILPCTGYIVDGCENEWKLGPYQSYTARPGCSRPFILNLSTSFIKRNKLSLRVASPSAGEVHMRVNGADFFVSGTQAEGITEPQNRVSTILHLYDYVLDAPSPNHWVDWLLHFTLDAIQLLGQLTMGVLLVCLFAPFLSRYSQYRNTSFYVMALVTVIFFYWHLPDLLAFENCPDLARSEPNLPLRLNAGGFKHPVFIQVWWKIAMAFIPVRSCMLAFAVAIGVLYLSGILLLQRMLCNLKHRWLAWMTFVVALQSYSLLLFTDKRVLVDYLLMSSALFAVCGIAILMMDELPRIVKLLLVFGVLFSAYTVLVVRHEALGVALAICVGMVGIYVRRKPLQRWRRLGTVLVAGALICGMLYGFHNFVEIKYWLPISKSQIKRIHIVELRRFLITDIVRTAYCQSKDLSSLPDAFLNCLNEELRDKFVTRWFEPPEFQSYSTRELKNIYINMVMTYPLAYLTNKLTTAKLWCMRMDSCAGTVDPNLAGIALPNGSQGVAIHLNQFQPSFGIHLSTSLAWLALIISFAMSSALVVFKPIFRGVAWLTFTISAAGLSHMVALIVVPVTISFRYISWIYCSGGIAFCLLLYLIINVVACLQRRQSWDIFYKDGGDVNEVIK